MNKQQIQRKTCMSVMPPNDWCLKCEWVFSIKCNGVYNVRLVACSYSQVSGVVFFKNYSLDLNDIMLQIIANGHSLWIFS